MSALRDPGFSSSGHMSVCQAGVQDSRQGTSRAVTVALGGPWNPWVAPFLWAAGSAHSAPLPPGPLPAPLHVLCPSQDELGRWLYHLEKQIALVGGLQRCHSVPPQVSAGNPHTPFLSPLCRHPLLPRPPFTRPPRRTSCPGLCSTG